jgi:excisionase family DNA binding protein
MAIEESLLKQGASLTVAQVAKALNVSQRHVYKLVAENQIPHFRIGDAVRFDSKIIVGWLDEQMDPVRKKPGR